MILGEGALGIILLAVWIFAIVDCISTDASLVRNLPKLVWILIVLALPDVGSILWLLLGRPARATFTPGSTTPRRLVAPEDSPTFTQDMERRRLQEWERRLREREDELKKKEQGNDKPFPFSW